MSKFLRLNKNDGIKAFQIFLIATIFSTVYEVAISFYHCGIFDLMGFFSIDTLYTIASAVLLAVLVYLKKNLLTNSSGQFFKKEEPPKYTKI